MCLPAICSTLSVPFPTLPLFALYRRKLLCKKKCAYCNLNLLCQVTCVMLGKEGVLVENYGGREQAYSYLPYYFYSECFQSSSWLLSIVTTCWAAPTLWVQSDLYWMLFGLSTVSFLGPSRLRTKQLSAAAGLWAGLPPLLAQRSTWLRN